MDKHNDNVRADARQDNEIVLGIASIETKGQFGPPNEGVDHRPMPGISEE